VTAFLERVSRVVTPNVTAKNARGSSVYAGWRVRYIVLVTFGVRSKK
jgi:hypothetical protein